MNVQDLMKEADCDIIATLWWAWMKDNPNYRNSSEAKISETLRKFTDMLSGIKTKPCNALLYAAYGTDLDEKDGIFSFRDSVGAFYVKKADFIEKLSKLKQIKLLPIPENADEGQGVMRESLRELFPENYGYEFQEWEETLAAEVIPENYEHIGKQEFISDILWELSFNGFSKKRQRKKRNELRRACRQVDIKNKIICAMPQKLRDLYYSRHYSRQDRWVNELMPKDERTEEEKAEKEKMNHYACVRGDLLILHELKRLADMDIAI